MTNLITKIRAVVADMNRANRRLFEIQTGIERPRRNRGEGHGDA